MTSAAYFPFLIQVVLAAGITGLVIGASHFFGQRSKGGAIKAVTDAINADRDVLIVTFHADVLY